MASEAAVKWVRASDLEALSKRWREHRAHTYSSENADHYRGFDAGYFRAAESLDRLISSAVPLSEPTVDRAEIVAILEKVMTECVSGSKPVIVFARRAYDLLAERCGWVK